MKKSTKHNLDDLIKRLVKSIEKRNPQEKIEESGKLFLKAKWKGQEAKLHELVKKMENEEVKSKNLNERLEKTSCTFQTGVDVLGFPQYTTHETLFQIDKDRKYPNNISATRVVDAIQYEHK